MGIKERARRRREKIEVNVAASHEEAEQWDLEFWQRRTPQERPAALAAIYEDIRKIKRSRS